MGRIISMAEFRKSAELLQEEKFATEKVRLMEHYQVAVGSKFYLKNSKMTMVIEELRVQKFQDRYYLIALMEIVKDKFTARMLPHVEMKTFVEIEELLAIGERV